MMKKIAVLLAILLFVTVPVFSKGTEEKAVDTGSGIKQFSGDLSVLVPAETAAALEAVMVEYNKIQPKVRLEATVYVDDAAKNAIITAKIASDDMPDVMVTVLNTLVIDLAKQGYLLPLTDTGIQNRLTISPEDYPLGVYDGDIYAIPMELSLAGIFANNEVLRKYGVTEYPKTFDELIATCDQLQKAGCAEPFLIAAKEVNPVNNFVYQYIYQNLYGNNPAWYADILRGVGHWNDPEFAAVYEAYGRLKPYMNKDALGLDNANSYRRFAQGDSAFFIGYNFGREIRIANPNLDYSLIPAPFNEKPEHGTVSTDTGNGYMITKNVKNKELALDFLEFLTRPENAAIFSKTLSSFSSVKGVEITVDPAGDYIQGLLSNGLPTNKTMTRTWIPGIKEYMKKGTQEWFAGADIQTVIDGIEKEHQRLMKASPDFVKTFLESFGK